MFTSRVKKFVYLEFCKIYSPGEHSLRFKIALKFHTKWVHVKSLEIPQCFIAKILPAIWAFILTPCTWVTHMLVVNRFHVNAAAPKMPTSLNNTHWHWPPKWRIQDDDTSGELGQYLILNTPNRTQFQKIRSPLLKNKVLKHWSRMLILCVCYGFTLALELMTESNAWHQL